MYGLEKKSENVTIKEVAPPQGSSRTTVSDDGTSVPEVYARDGRGVVSVDVAATSEAGPAGGSGFVLDEAGHIVTNQHVVGNAEDTVRAFYTMTSDGDYDRSAKLLSEKWRRSTFPNRATFEGTFDKVERVVFIEGPNAEISGNTATVTGETRATLTGEVQHNEGTWYLMQEDDRWKIDGWDVVELSSRSVQP